MFTLEKRIVFYVFMTVMVYMGIAIGYCYAQSASYPAIGSPAFNKLVDYNPNFNEDTCSLEEQGGRPGMYSSPFTIPSILDACEKAGEMTNANMGECLIHPSKFKVKISIESQLALDYYLKLYEADTKKWLAHNKHRKC